MNCDTGKTCLGGGMHCHSASSFIHDILVKGKLKCIARWRSSVPHVSFASLHLVEGNYCVFASCSVC